MPSLKDTDSKYNEVESVRANGDSESLRKRPMSDDPTCNVCGERKSAHISTEKGPFTHPMEARGEGHYEMVSPWHIQGGGAWYDDMQWPPTYRFVESSARLHRA